MEKNNRDYIIKETNLNSYFTRFTLGIEGIVKDKKKAIVFVIYILLICFLWVTREKIFKFYYNPYLPNMSQIYSELLLPLTITLSLIGVIILLGTPLGSDRISRNLMRIGLVNHAGEAPKLIRETLDKNSKVSVMEFETNGIPKTKWIDKSLDIEASLNIHIIKCEEGINKRRILLYVVSADKQLPALLHWKDEYLSQENFELVIGESFLKRETVNLAYIPHILLGGSTGSGKSVLLKLLLLQCIKKGAEVHIADFKGGIDFSTNWDQYCKLIVDEDTLSETLNMLVEELERRKLILRAEGSTNIDEYNARNGGSLQRIIFACDEIAEILDKTGRNKLGKDNIAFYENRLATIARQGRAFGIHLIIATQRPDANILTGQIRNNIDFRVCGRADNVLSQIILDNTDASDAIDKDAQGRFITGNGTVFQGYMFAEDTLL